MDLSVLDDLKTKELRKEYKAFLGEEDKHSDYYLKRFDKMDDTGGKFSLNFAAFFFSTYWCFYRKLFGPGAIFLLFNFAGLYLTIMKPELASLGSALAFIPAIACGLFGNFFYYNYVRKNIALGLDKSYEEKAKLYTNNGGTSVRIVLGIVAAFLCFGLALFFSAGPAAVENLQKTTPLPVVPPAE